MRYLTFMAMLLAGPAFAGSALTITMQTEHGEMVTLTVTSKEAAEQFCKTWKSDSAAFGGTAKQYRKDFATLARTLGSASILSETCAGH